MGVSFVASMTARVQFLALCGILCVAWCEAGGGQQQEEEPKAGRYANHVGTTKQAGVMRCDPFGDYGAFWGVTSEKFDGKLKTISGKTKDMKKYKGKSMLVANIGANAEDATKQMQLLNDMATSYAGKLDVLGFWSSEFADKDVTSPEAFRKQLKAKLPADFKLKFIISDNIKTNGPRQHACFRWLKDQCGAEEITHAFTKFLMTRQGRVHKKYDPSVGADIIKPHIDAIINRDEI